MMGQDSCHQIQSSRKTLICPTKNPNFSAVSTEPSQHVRHKNHPDTRFDGYETLCPQQMLVHKGGQIKNWSGECRDLIPTKLQCQTIQRALQSPNLQREIIKKNKTTFFLIFTKYFPHHPLFEAPSCYGFRNIMITNFQSPNLQREIIRKKIKYRRLSLART